MGLKSTESSVAEPNVTTLAPSQDAEAIVLDFVNPGLAFWRLIDRRRKLGFNELEPLNYKRHDASYL